MKVIAQVKLLPVPQETVALAATLQVVNEAANWVSELAYTRNIRSRQGLQRLAYREVKERFGLSAQPALHVIRLERLPQHRRPRGGGVAGCGAAVIRPCRLTSSRGRAAGRGRNLTAREEPSRKLGRPPRSRPRR